MFLSFLVAPIMGILATALPLLMFTPESKNALENLTVMSIIFGAPMAYGIMLVIGLPTILVVEVIRPKKSIATIIYILFATLPCVAIPSLLFLLQGALLAGATVAIIMLWKRKDWEKTSSE